MARTTWHYRADVRPQGADLIGYDVEAKDGEIGKVVEESAETDASHIVVDTGFWIFGTKRLVPAGLIGRIDADEQRIWVDMTKEQVEKSPEYDSPGGLVPEPSAERDLVDEYRRPFVDYFAASHII